MMVAGDRVVQEVSACSPPRKTGRTSRHRSNRPFAILLSVPLLVSLACGAGGGTPADSSPEPVALQRDVVYGAGPFDMPDPRSGLSDLTSYQATLTLSFEGTEAGQPKSWTKTYVLLKGTEPAIRLLTVESSGDLADMEPVLMAEAYGASYERVGEDVCRATLIDVATPGGEQLEPAGLLNFVIGADEAGAETVNDIAVTHYTFDQRALGQEDRAESTGEMWVATEGGYVVKYVLSTTGGADTFGEGIEGTLHYDYELTSVNQPVEIILPADCPLGIVDAPQLPDASNVLNMPGLLSYDTASSLEDAAAFYQTELPESGWTVFGEPAIFDTAALLVFTKDDQTMTVNISAENGVTTVHIGLSRVQ